MEGGRNESDNMNELEAEMFDKNELIEKRMKKEISKLKKIYKRSDKKHMAKIEELINRASFLLIVSQDIEEELKNNNQYMITTINASQTFKKPNPLLKEHRDTIKSYQAVIKQLDEMSDEKNSPSSEPNIPDELEAFLSK